MDRLAGMTAGGIVDGHMQLKIVAIDAQFREFMGGDQQVQWGLLVAQVVADHLRQEGIEVLSQSQLQSALQITRRGQGQQLLTPHTTEQPLVDQHVIATRVALAEFFEVGTNEAVVARVMPMMQDTLQPSTVDSLGWRNLLQNHKAWDRLAKYRRGPLTPCLKIQRILLGHAGGTAGGPVVQLRRRSRQIIRQRVGAIELVFQPLLAIGASPANKAW